MAEQKSAIAATDGVPTRSTGQAYVNAGYLYAHYRIAQREYDESFANVGISKGCRVLDAVCGDGAFLGHLAQTVGRKGNVVVYGLAPEYLAAIEQRKQGDTSLGNIETRLGNVTKLPFENGTFDAV